MSDNYLPAPMTPQAAASSSGTAYELIHAAVTETERGRWFLTEYARRNRHADTEQVLAAIARLEAALVMTREAGSPMRLHGDIADMVKAIAAPQPAPPASPASEPARSEALDKTEMELDAIIQATERATSDILAAAERIQEIAWTLREQGVDAAACDELDRRATDIYTACSFQDLTGQQTDRVIEHLRHPDEPDDTAPRLDQAGVDRVVPAQAASIPAAAFAAAAAELVVLETPTETAIEAAAIETPVESAIEVAASETPVETACEVPPSAAVEATSEDVTAAPMAAPDDAPAAMPIEPEAETPVAAVAEVEAATVAQVGDDHPHEPTGSAISTDALLADLLAMIRQAKQSEPHKEPAPAGQTDGDWNKPLFPQALDADIAWLEDPTAPLATAEPVAAIEQPEAAPAAEPAVTAAPQFDEIDEDDLLLPIAASWTPPGDAGPAPLAAAPAPKIVETPATEPAPPTSVAAMAASSRPSPLAAVAAAALAGEPLSSVPASPPSATPSVPADLPDAAPARTAVSNQALAAVAALSTLSEIEKVALFS